MNSRNGLVLCAMLLCFIGAIPSSASASERCSITPQLVAKMNFLYGAYVTVGAVYLEPTNARKAVVAYLKYLTPYPLSSDGKPPRSRAYNLVFTGTRLRQSTESYRGYGYSVKTVPVSEKVRKHALNVYRQVAKSAMGIIIHLNNHPSAPVAVYTANNGTYHVRAYVRERLTKDGAVRTRTIVRISHGSCSWREVYPRESVVDVGFFEYQGNRYLTIVLYAHLAGLFPTLNTYELPTGN